MWPFRKPAPKPVDKRTSHHYVLAHIALRHFATEDPYSFFNVMGSPQRQDFLDYVWRQICQYCDKDGLAAFTSRDLNVLTTRIGNYPAVVVTMPPPQFAPEAYMICVVLLVSLEDISRQPDNPSVRYFTLEKGEIFRTGETYTVLCEWVDDEHNNYGNGPEATQAAFIDSIRQIIE